LPGRRRIWVVLLALGVLAVSGWLTYTIWFASSTDDPALLYFRSDSCAYCKEMAPVIAQICRKYRKQVNVVTVDLDRDEGKKTARRYGIIGTPTLLLLDREGHEGSVIRGTLPASVIEQAVKDLTDR